MLSFTGGMVLVDERTHRLFAYNESASLIWRELSGGRTLRDAAATLVKAYGISSEQAERDTGAIIAHWRSLSLLNDRAVATPPDVMAVAIAPADERPSFRADYRIGGYSVRIAVDDADVARRVETLLRPYAADVGHDAETMAVRKDGARNGLVLECEGVETLRTDSVAEMTGGLFQTILSRVHPNETWLAIIHGGAIASNGRAILIPGASGSGKTTLAAFLIARGFAYLSDDMIALNETGAAASWPIPLSLKQGSWAPLAPYLPQVAALPAERVWNRMVKFLSVETASWQKPPVETGAFLFPKFRPDAGAARLMRLTPMETLQRLLSDRIWLGYPLTAEAVERFLAWLAHMPSYDLTHGSFEGVEHLVAEVAGHDRDH